MLTISILNIIICVLYIILTHWVADFILQTNHMAERKSTSNYYLTMHVSVYSTVTIISWLIFFSILGIHNTIWVNLLAYVLIFSTHWITDYFTSRKNSVLWKNKQVHDFFVMIGFDQTLHYYQLVLIYYIVILSSYAC
jgi:hypothetical protein